MTQQYNHFKFVPTEPETIGRTWYGIRKVSDGAPQPRWGFRTVPISKEKYRNYVLRQAAIEEHFAETDYGTAISEHVAFPNGISLAQRVADILVFV
jgi:hypothetical protein